MRIIRRLGAERAEASAASDAMETDTQHLLLQGALVYENVRFRGVQQERITRVGDYIDVDGFGNCEFGYAGLSVALEDSRDLELA